MHCDCGIMHHGQLRAMVVFLPLPLTGSLHIFNFVTFGLCGMKLKKCPLKWKLNYHWSTMLDLIVGRKTKDRGEDHQEGGVQFCSPSSWRDVSKRKWECERESEWTSLQIWRPELIANWPLQKNLRVWNAIGIKLVFTFLQTKSGCQTQTIPRPWNLISDVTSFHI